VSGVFVPVYFLTNFDRLDRIYLRQKVKDLSRVPIPNFQVGPPHRKPLQPKYTCTKPPIGWPCTPARPTTPSTPLPLQTASYIQRVRLIRHNSPPTPSKYAQSPHLHTALPSDVLLGSPERRDGKRNRRLILLYLRGSFVLFSTVHSMSEKYLI